MYIGQGQILGQSLLAHPTGSSFRPCRFWFTAVGDRRMTRGSVNESYLCQRGLFIVLFALAVFAVD